MKPEISEWLEDGNMDWVEREYFSQPKNVSWSVFVEEVYRDIIEYGGYTYDNVGDFGVSF